MIENLTNQKIANAHSVLALVGADIKQGDVCVMTVNGEDCQTAYHELVRFLTDEFPHCDETLPETCESPDEVVVPPVLQVAGIPLLLGRPVVAGLGRGYVVRVNMLALPKVTDDSEDVDITAELHRMEVALAELQRELTLKLKSGRSSSLESQILETHLSIIKDVSLIDKVKMENNRRGMQRGSRNSPGVSLFFRSA